MNDMTPRAASDDTDDLWPIILEGIEKMSDAPAREHLAAGFPIYYWEEGTPPGLVIKKHPDGRRELVRHSRDRDEVIRTL